MPGRVLRFASYELDYSSHELRQAGRVVRLQLQPVRVLEILVANAGNVVTREEFRRQIWPASVFLDFDHGLNNAINRLRHALGDCAEASPFIETVPRVGYRLLCPVVEDSRQTHLKPDHEKTHIGLSGSKVEASSGRNTLLLRRVIARAAWAIVASSLLVLVVSQPFRDGSAPDLSAPNADNDSSADRASYEAYVQGRHLWNQRNKEAVSRSIEYFKRAIRLDPSFAFAYAGLAEAYATQGGNTLVQSVPADEVRAAALNAAHRALQLDDSLGEAHAALGQVIDKLFPWSDENDTVIEHAYLRAIELSPRYADVRLWYGNFLSSRERSREAIAQYGDALIIDPISPSINSRFGVELFNSGRIEEGLELLARTTEIDPWQFNAHVRLGWAYASIDRFDEAIQAFRAADRVSPDSAPALAGQAFVAARHGDSAQALAMLETLLSASESLRDPFHVAIVYVGLRDKNNSILWLEKTAQSSRVLHRAGPYGLRSPLYDWLRDDPRLIQLQAQIDETQSVSRATAASFTNL